MKKSPLPDTAGEALPPDWAPRNVGELCDIISGGTPAKNEPDYWQGSIPWVSGKDLKSPCLRDTIDHISESALKAGSKLAPPGAVLLLVRGMGLAKDLPVATIDRAMAFNQDVKALIPRGPLPGMFLRTAIYVHKDRLLSRMVPSAHGTMTLNLDDVQNLTIPVPNDPAEALAISSFVRLSLRMLEVESDLEAGHTELKRVAMQELFTKGLRRETLKETEIGTLPESWSVEEIGRVSSKVQYGLSVRGEPSGRTPILRMNCQDKGKVVMRDLQFVDLDAKLEEDFLVRPGDILFNRTNSIELVGRTAIVEEDVRAVFASYLIRVQVNAALCDPHYLNHFMNDPRTQLEIKKLASRAVGQANINGTKLKGVRFPLPPLDEQREIVAMLDAIDRKISLHKTKRAVLEALFQSLLHKLMTGAVRVADLNLDALAAAEQEAA